MVSVLRHCYKKFTELSLLQLKPVISHDYLYLYNKFTKKHINFQLHNSKKSKTLPKLFIRRERYHSTRVQIKIREWLLSCSTILVSRIDLSFQVGLLVLSTINLFFLRHQLLLQLFDQNGSLFLLHQSNQIVWTL